MAQTTYNIIEIWAPRFKDLKVLIKPWRIQPGLNKVIFTKTWRDKELIMDGEKMKSYPMEGHGEAGVYAIPVRDFEMEETSQTQLL